MKSKLGYIFGGLCLMAVMVVFTPAQTHALVGIDKALESNTKSVRDAIRARSEEAQRQQAQELEEKRTQLQEKLEERRANIGEVLSGERMKRCQAKEADINSSLDGRHAIAERHLERFKSIQQRLMDFVDERELGVTNESALRVIMNDKKTAAQSTVDILRDTTFVCLEASSTTPGTIVISQIGDAKLALHNYRDAIKQYASAVKQAVSEVSQ